jgi:chitodextrinase
VALTAKALPSPSYWQRNTRKTPIGTARPTPTPTPKPQAAPNNLVAVGVSTSQINLTWTKSSDSIAGYYVERAESPNGPWKRVASLSHDATSCANGGLNGHTIYYYRLMAHNSGYSNVASATTLSMLPAGGPNRLTAMARGSDQISLSWTNTAGDAAKLRIERCQGAGCSNFTKIATVAPDVTSHQDMGLSPSTSYSYRVKAFNSATESEYSNVATSNTTRNTAPPSIPTGLIATVVSSSRISLVWIPSTSKGSEVAGYNVYQAGSRIGSTVGTNYRVQELEAKTQYCYTITAYDKSGNASGQSDPVCATTKSPDDPQQ